MLKNKKKDKDSAVVNEFDQVLVGNSLTKDAWKRLRKNKMAVIGLIIVCIYAFLAAFASFLPMYSYDEIILDHQNLPPSFNTSAGELMMQDKLEGLFFTSWKEGRLDLTDEQDAQIKSWIEDSKTTKVWDMVYTQGMIQIASGNFTWTEAEQKKIDKLQKEIDTELFVTIDKVKVDGVVLEKLSSDQVAQVYADLLGLDDTVAILAQTETEMRALVGNTLELTEEQKEMLSDAEIDSRIDDAIVDLGAESYESKLVANLVGKVDAQILRNISKELRSQNAEGTVTFPLKETVEVNDGVIASVTASLKSSRHYLLGTDYSGRDLLARIIYGGQISIMIGLIGTLFSVFIGIVLGALAGYLGGRVDYIIMRIVDVMYGLPYMLIVIIFMAIFGRSIMNLFVALGIVSWLTIARMVRGQIMSLKNSEYVEAARSMGAKTWRIIFRHMIPNSLSIIIVYSTLRVPAFIMQESFLSFLGLGVQAPFASWGSLISNGVASMTIYPWRLIFPSIAMTLFLFAMNFFGDGLRDAFDPQSKNQL
jgi:oligopeptide transport system permease protein